MPASAYPRSLGDLLVLQEIAPRATLGREEEVTLLFDPCGWFGTREK